MPLKKLSYSLFIICIFILGCNNEASSKYGDEKNHKNSKNEKESLVKVNRYMVNTEYTEIENYINRHSLVVIETGSGLKYQITKSGTGEKAETGKYATIVYNVKLITGDIIYSSEEDGPLTFKIGHGGVETGLEEAILNMRVGDEAIIIIPSHLGHGLLGDGKKIPQRSTIIYEVEFTNIN